MSVRVLHCPGLSEADAVTLNINGLKQRLGIDWHLDGDTLVFDEELPADRWVHLAFHVTAP